jgi:hypothetical protein
MRPNRYVILVSVLLGLFGAWLTADALAQYLNTARSFTAIRTQYVPDSFEWQDPEYRRARAEIVIVNESENDALVDYFSISLYFDDDFAGADYEPWERFVVPAGEERTFEVNFLTTAPFIRHLGGEATLRVRGQMRLVFDGIQQPMTVRTSGTIGQVPYEGED